MLNMLGTFLNKEHIEIFFLFLTENKSCDSCKLSPMETVGMKGRPVFWENKFKKYHQFIKAKHTSTLVSVENIVMFGRRKRQLVSGVKLADPGVQ